MSYRLSTPPSTSPSMDEEFSEREAFSPSQLDAEAARNLIERMSEVRCALSTLCAVAMLSALCPHLYSALLCGA